MTLTVRLANVYGQDVGVQRYTIPSDIYIRQPLTTFYGARETNQFNLIIYPQNLANNAGEVTIFSANFFDSLGFAQYWQYTLFNNNTFSGRLVNNYNNFGLAINLLTVPQEIAPSIWLNYSLAIAQGATLSGTYNDTQVSIRVNGNSIGGQTPFILDVSGTRPTFGSGPLSNPEEAPKPPTLTFKTYLPSMQH